MDKSHEAKVNGARESTRKVEKGGQVEMKKILLTPQNIYDIFKIVKCSCIN